MDNNIGEAAVNGLKKIVNFIKNMIKFFTSGIGILTLKIIAVALIVVFIYILGNVIFNGIKGLLFDDDSGMGTDEYDTSSVFLQNLSNSGYDSMLSSSQLMNYYSFEYAVLMDEAEYIETVGVSTIDKFNEAVIDWQHEALSDEAVKPSGDSGSPSGDATKFRNVKLKIWAALAAKAMQMDPEFKEDINDLFEEEGVSGERRTTPRPHTGINLPSGDGIESGDVHDESGDTDTSGDVYCDDDHDPNNPKYKEFFAAIDEWNKDPDWDENYCLGWVNTFFGPQFNSQKLGYHCARCAMNALLKAGQAAHLGDPPIGAVIFFDTNHKSVKHDGQLGAEPGTTGDYGHVGISVGNGKFISGGLKDSNGHARLLTLNIAGYDGGDYYWAMYPGSESLFDGNYKFKVIIPKSHGGDIDEDDFYYFPGGFHIPLVKEAEGEDPEYRITKGSDIEEPAEPGSLHYLTTTNDYTGTTSLVPYFRSVRTDHNLRYFFELDNITSHINTPIYTDLQLWNPGNEKFYIGAEKDSEYAGYGLEYRGYVTFENTTWSNGKSGLWKNTPVYDNANNQEQIDKYQRTMARIGSAYHMGELISPDVKSSDSITKQHALLINRAHVYRTPPKGDKQRESLKTMAEEARYEVDGGVVGEVEVKDAWNFIYSFVRPTRFNLDLNCKNYAAFYYRDVRYGLYYGNEGGEPKREDYDLNKEYDAYQDLYYYQDDKFVTYDIPLRVILDRFLPNASLLSSWRLLSKEGYSTVFGEETDEANDLVEDIMEVYNHYSLQGESLGLKAYLVKDVFINTEEVSILSSPVDLLNGSGAGQPVLGHYLGGGATDTMFGSYLPKYDSRGSGYKSKLNDNVTPVKLAGGSLSDDIADDVKLVLAHHADKFGVQFDGGFSISISGASGSANGEPVVLDTIMKDGMPFLKIAYQIKDGLKTTGIILCDVNYGYTNDSEKYYGYIIRDKEVEEIESHSNNLGFAKIESGELQATTFKHWEFADNDPKGGGLEQSYEAWFVQDAFEALDFDIQINPHFKVDVANSPAPTELPDPNAPVKKYNKDLYGEVETIREDVDPYIKMNQELELFIYSQLAAKSDGVEPNHSGENYRPYFNETKGTKLVQQEDILKKGTFAVVRPGDIYKHSAGTSRPSWTFTDIKDTPDYITGNNASYSLGGNLDKANVTIGSRKELYQERGITKRVMNASINPQVLQQFYFDPIGEMIGPQMVRADGAQVSTMATGEIQDIFGKKASGDPSASQFVGETHITEKNYLDLKKYIGIGNYQGYDQDFSIPIDHTQKEVECYQLQKLIAKDDTKPGRCRYYEAIAKYIEANQGKLLHNGEEAWSTRPLKLATVDDYFKGSGDGPTGEMIALKEWIDSMWIGDEWPEKEVEVEHTATVVDPHTGKVETYTYTTIEKRRVSDRDFHWSGSHEENSIYNPEFPGQEVDDLGWKIDNFIQCNLSVIYPTRVAIMPISQRVIDRHLPVYLVKEADYWAGEKEFQNTIINRGEFADKDNYIYLVHQNSDAIGVTKIDSKYERVEWRCNLFAPIFGTVRDDNSGREGDIKLILSEWEEISEASIGAADHAIRDLNSLIQYTKGWSGDAGISGETFEPLKRPDGKPYINENSYTFLYIPEEILSYNELNCENAFWMDRVLATWNDPIQDNLADDNLKIGFTNENQMRSKLPKFTWQQMNYDLYEETQVGNSSQHSSYALWPFGGQHSRLLYSMASLFESGGSSNALSGADSWGDSSAVHNAADLLGRMSTTKIYRSVFGDTTSGDREMVDIYTGYGYYTRSGDRAAIQAKYNGTDVILYDRDGKSLVGQVVDTRPFVDNQKSTKSSKESSTDPLKYSEAPSEAKDFKDFNWEWDDLFEVALTEQGNLGLDEKDTKIELKLGKNKYKFNGTAAAVYAYEAYRTALALKDKEGLETEKLLKSSLEKEIQWSEIRAIAPGVVTDVGGNAVSGFWVEILHSNEGDISSAYLHMKRYPLVQKGQYVGAGTLLGYEGSTGRTEGIHTHFEILNGESKAGVPTKYLYPFFMPFWNIDKVEEVVKGIKKSGRDPDIFLDSEYFTPARTVYPYQKPSLNAKFKMFTLDKADKQIQSLRVPSTYLTKDSADLLESTSKEVFHYDIQIGQKPQPKNDEFVAKLQKYREEMENLNIDGKIQSYLGGGSNITREQDAFNDNSPKLHTDTKFSSGDYIKTVLNSSGKINNGKKGTTVDSFGPIAKRRQEMDPDNWVQVYYNRYPINPRDPRYIYWVDLKDPYRPLYPGDDGFSGGSSGGGGSMGLGLGDSINRGQLWNTLVSYFESKGASKEVAEYATAGMMGHLYWESNLICDIANFTSSTCSLATIGMTPLEYREYLDAGGDVMNVNGKGKGPAYGIAQWWQGRLANLQAFCRGKGVSVGNSDAQIEFLISELDSMGIGSRMINEGNLLSVGEGTGQGSDEAQKKVAGATKLALNLHGGADDSFNLEARITQAFSYYASYANK